MLQGVRGDIDIYNIKGAVADSNFNLLYFCCVVIVQGSSGDRSIRSEETGIFCRSESEVVSRGADVGRHERDLCNLWIPRTQMGRGM